MDSPIENDVPVSEYQDGNLFLKKLSDGSVLLEEENQMHGEVPMDPMNHDQNLAECLPDHVLKEISHYLKRAIEDDIQSQEEFFEGIAKIIELLGIHMTQTAEKEDLPFKGASTVYSMALWESALDLQASAISSLYPSSNMVDCVIRGESNNETLDTSYRKKTFFNYYLTDVAKEFKKESKRTILWAILCGSCYKKVFICPVLGRPTSQFIRPEDFIVNRSYTTHLTATRKTHITYLNYRDLQIRRLKGIYRDVAIMRQSGEGQTDNFIQDQLNLVSGHTEDFSNDYDDLYKIYECHIDYKIKEDILAPQYDLPIPYIITMDENSGQILRIQRNWKKGDFLTKKREYFVNYSLLPSLDGEGYGLVNYAGRSAQAATVLKRQIINATTYANFPGGMYQSGIRLENNNIRPAPGEFVPIQTGGLPINQCIDTLPYKDASPTAINLLDREEDDVKRPSSIINQKIMDMAPRAPMGSVLAMLENLQKVPNLILSGFHESFGHELMLFNDRFSEWLPEGQPYPFMVPGGEHAIMKSDFQDNIIVVPASDPSLQNTTYRFMQSEIILNQARQNPDIHNMRFACEYLYKNLGLSPENIENLLPPPQKNEPVPLDPITENQNLMTGKPVKAGIMQDQDAHITTHSLITQNPQSTPEQRQAAQAHIQEHESLKLLIEMQQKIGFEMPQDPSQIPPEVQNQIAVAAAQVAAQKLQEIQAQTQRPEPPLDPARVELEEVHRRAEADRLKHQIDEIKLQIEEQKLLMNHQLEEQRLQQKNQVDKIKSDLDAAKINLDAVLREKDLLLRQLKELKTNQPIEENYV